MLELTPSWVTNRGAASDVSGVCGGTDCALQQEFTVFFVVTKALEFISKKFRMCPVRSNVSPCAQPHSPTSGCENVPRNFHVRNPRL